MSTHCIPKMGLHLPFLFEKKTTGCYHKMFTNVTLLLDIKHVTLFPKTHGGDPVFSWAIYHCRIYNLDYSFIKCTLAYIYNDAISMF